MSRRVISGLVFATALVFAGPALGMEPRWPSGPYKYLVIDQDIKGVLVEFGRNVGLPVDVSDQVKGRLRGQLAMPTARQFLDSMCANYGLVWYFDGAVLHVNTKAEVRTELVSIGRLSPEEATDKLGALGIADARFTVRTTENTGVVSVSGPPSFVSMVRQTLDALVRQLPPPIREGSYGDEITVRVFRGGTTSPPTEVWVASRAKS